MYERVEFLVVHCSNSDQWPGVAATRWIGGELTVLDAPGRAALDRFDFFVAQECSYVERDAVAELGDLIEQLIRYWLLAEFPDYCSELVFGSETQAVVDSPDRARAIVGIRQVQAMTAFAVGVVGNDVEQCDSAKLIVSVGEGFENREVMLTLIGCNEPLHRPLTERPFADHSGRNHANIERLAKEVGGKLSPVKAGLEVPQRSLALHRLVDRWVRPLFVNDVHQVRGVAAVGHLALDFDLAAQQMLNRVFNSVDA